MAAGYDGSINIDTSISPRGFNAGIKRLGDSMNGFVKSVSGGFGKISSKLSTVSEGMSGAMSGVVAGVGKAVAAVGAVAGVVIGVVAAIALIAVALVGAGIAIFNWAQKFTDTLYKSLSATSAYHSQVMALKGAFDTLKGTMMGLGTTLLTAITPALMTVINWLVKAINYVSMFIAALSGQKTVMQYVSGSANGAANSTGKAAKNTDKLAKSTKNAQKAAQGALAAFDQINVLQKDTAEIAEEIQPDTNTSGGGSGGNIKMIEVEIDPTILEKVEKIKNWFSDALDWILGILKPVWSWFKLNVIDPIWNSILWLWGIIKESATALWNGGLQEVLNIFWIFIKGAFTGQLKAGFDMIKNIFKDILVTVTGVIKSSIQFFGGLIEFITGVFTGDWKKAWQGIQDMFKGVFNGIVVIVGGVVNTVIDLINGMIAGVIAGVNAVIKALNTVSIKIPAMLGKPAYTFGINLATLGTPQIPKLPIPKLATGAVIPANAPFAAILGDQRHGTNIEAPADLIRQIVREEIGQGGGSQNINISFQGGMSELIRILNPVITRENNRIGKSLIVGE